MVSTECIRKFFGSGNNFVAYGNTSRGYTETIIDGKFCAFAHIAWDYTHMQIPVSKLS